jgi:hypothetical protein
LDKILGAVGGMAYAALLIGGLISLALGRWKNGQRVFWVLICLGNWSCYAILFMAVPRYKYGLEVLLWLFVMNLMTLGLGKMQRPHLGCNLSVVLEKQKKYCLTNKKYCNNTEKNIF